MSTRQYKIGAAARLLDTTVRSLRYYEEQGLIQARRNPAGTRYYNDAELQRLRAILDLGHSGFSIDTIRELATTRSDAGTGQQSSAAMSTMLAEILDQVSDHIEALQAVQTDLAAASEAIQGCRQCQNPPSTQGCPDCPVINQRKQVDMLNLIWDTDEPANE